MSGTENGLGTAGNGEWSVQGSEEALSGKMGRVILHLHRGLHQCIQRLSQTLGKVGVPLNPLDFPAFPRWSRTVHRL